jgi:hypothetical protein
MGLDKWRSNCESSACQIFPQKKLLIFKEHARANQSSSFKDCVGRVEVYGAIICFPSTSSLLARRGRGRKAKTNFDDQEQTRGSRVSIVGTVPSSLSDQFLHLRFYLLGYRLHCEYASNDRLHICGENHTIVAPELYYYPLSSPALPTKPWKDRH